MSQHIVKIDGKTEAQVGWDPPLQTFYGQVYKLDENGERVDIYVENGEEKDGTIVWVGGSGAQIHDIEDLVHKLSPRVHLNRGLRASLYRDRDENR